MPVTGTLPNPSPQARNLATHAVSRCVTAHDTTVLVHPSAHFPSHPALMPGRHTGTAHPGPASTAWPRRRDTVRTAPSTSASGAPSHAARVEHLERLLLLRRFYRNCVRAEAYYRSSAAAYVPCTEGELAEMVSDEDRAAAVDARKNEALVVLVDMQVVSEQLKARPGAPHAMLLVVRLCVPGAEGPRRACAR